MLDAVTSPCEERGIGLIRIGEPARAATDGCDILADPRRRPTLNAVVNGFPGARPTAEQKRPLGDGVGSAG